jgi:hypothetical protein
MITLNRVIRNINPKIFRELSMNRADEIVQYALVLHLHNKDIRNPEKHFWEGLCTSVNEKDKITIWEHAVNRFTAEFIKEFCNGDGSINWEKLVHFNRGMKEKQ